MLLPVVTIHYAAVKRDWPLSWKAFRLWDTKSRAADNRSWRRWQIGSRAGDGMPVSVPEAYKVKLIAEATPFPHDQNKTKGAVIKMEDTR